jgi:hypothetical protein
MLRRVALVRTDVSEELSAPFIRVTRIGELGTLARKQHPEIQYYGNDSLGSVKCCEFLQQSMSTSKLSYERQSVGQSVLVIKSPSGTHNQFFFHFHGNYFQTVGGLLLWRALSVIYSCCSASLSQSFSGLSPTGLFLLFNFEASDMKGQVGQGGRLIPNGHWVHFLSPLTMCRASWKVEVSVMLRSTVAINFSFTSMDNIFRHLPFSSCGVPSLTRGRVCNLSLQLLLGLTSSVTLRSKSLRTWGHILLSHLRLISFLSPLTTRVATVEVSYPPRVIEGSSQSQRTLDGRSW